MFDRKCDSLHQTCSKQWLCYASSPLHAADDYHQSTVHCLNMQLCCLEINARSGQQDLPLELLAAVLQHLQQKDRLTSCALVNKIWREAANMATTKLSCFTAQKGFDSLLLWFGKNKYASRIREIFVGDGDDGRVIFNLPADILVNLESLYIMPVCNLVVTNRASCTGPAAPAVPNAANITSGATALEVFTGKVPSEPHVVSIPALRALKELTLDMTHLDLSDLGSCTALQHLWLCLVNHHEPVSSSLPVVTSSDKAANSSPQDLLASDEAAAGVAAEPEDNAAEDDPFNDLEEDVPGYEVEEKKVRYLPPQLVAALPQLTQLTSLSLQYSSCLRGEQHPTKPVSASLSSLQQLKRLQINIEDFKGLDLTHLPTSLTSLQMQGCYQRPTVMTVVTMPGLQHLVQLQSLHLSDISRLDAELLSSLINLTALNLSGCSFASTSAVQQLLVGLQHLDKLETLDLCESLKRQATTADVYSAMTASSQLTWLSIEHCSYASRAVEHIFPGPDSSSTLRRFSADAHLFQEPGSLGRLSASCPTLEGLDIHMCYEYDYSSWLGDWQVSFQTMLQSVQWSY